MSSIFLKDFGVGQPVVLLHGFLESHLIWNHLARELSANFRVLLIDLPGFGDSKAPANEEFTLAEIADKIIRILEERAIGKMAIIGHSLGGYVSLEMVKKRPELFSSIVLFHSTAYEDSQEKKESRTKTIEFIKKNGAYSFTYNFISPLFASSGHPSIPFVRTLAVQTHEQVVVGYLKAMRDRQPNTELLTTFNGAILFIAGENDTVIAASAIEKQSKTAKKATFLLLPEVAHMGMFEADEQCCSIIKDFLIKLSD